MSPRQRRYDVVVIGAGTAGLVAGTRLAQAGADVCVVAKGVGSTHLAAGTVDVLGYLLPHDPQASDARPETFAGRETVADQRFLSQRSPSAGAQRGRVPVSDPLAAIGDELTAQRPDHPYALIGAPAVAEALEWFTGTASRGPQHGYTYTGNANRNVLLPTAVGALKPSAIVPETMIGGDAATLGRVCVVGIPSLRDFHPQLCAANLQAAGIDARGVMLDVRLDRADANNLGIARLLDNPTSRAAFVAQLAPLVRGADQVALPACLGLTDPHGVLRDIESRLGRRVFEIPTLPPSVPGMRLYEILRHALRSAGGRQALGAGVVTHERKGERIVSISTATAGSETTYTADQFVLASGGFHSGAITLDSHWMTRELVLDLPLAGVPGPDEARFVPEYFAEQPMARVGVAVDRDLRARGAENVVVAGASLPGAASWREGSGEGIAIATGYRAAHTAAASLGTKLSIDAANAGDTTTAEEAAA